MKPPPIPSVVAALVISVSGFARAQESVSLRLSLEDAITRAIDTSHRLEEARARAAAADGVIAVNDAADRPIVSTSAGYTRTNHVTEFIVPSATGQPRVLYPDAPDNYRARLDLQWPIYDSGRTGALTLAAQAEAAAAAADVGATLGDVRLEVAQSFWALVTARSTISVLEQGVARARAHLEDARARFSSGLVPPNEVASAEAQESRQRLLLIEAENQRALSSAELARLIGLDLATRIEPAAVLDAPSSDLAEDPPPTLVSLALSLRSERRALGLRADAADQQRLAVLAAGRPRIAVLGGFDYARPNPRIFPRAERWDDSWEAGVSVSWSLWDGGRVRSEAAVAASRAAAARFRVEEFDSVVALEVRQRVLEIDSGGAAVAAADDAIRAATEARRVVNERYQVGVATQTELLDADYALLQAELDRTRALAGVRLAEAQLARALGR